MKIGSVLTSACFAATALAIGQNSTINFNGQGLCLAEGGSSVQIYVEPSDWPAVLRVADDLAVDFGKVTGVNGSVSLLKDGSKPSLNASMIFNVTGKSGFGENGGGKKGGAIIAGTIGNSTIIDRLIRQKKIDVSQIEGTWEAYVSTVVQNPMPGVSQAVVVAGESGRCTRLWRDDADHVLQDQTAEALSMACTPSRSKLESRHGTTGQIRPCRSMMPFTPSRLPLSRSLHPSSTAASS